MSRIFVIFAIAIVAIKIILGITSRVSPFSNYDQKLENALDVNDPFFRNRGAIADNLPSGPDHNKNQTDFLNNLTKNFKAVHAPNPHQTGGLDNFKKKKTAAELYEEEQKKIADAKKKRDRRKKLKKLAQKIKYREKQRARQAAARQRMLEEWLRRNQAKNGTQSETIGAPYTFDQGPVAKDQAPPSDDKKTDELKTKGPFEPADIEAWAKKLTSDPTVQEARTFISLYFSGEITREQYYGVLLMMQQSENANSRRYAVMGAGIQQEFEAFTILTDLSSRETNSEVQDAATKSLYAYRSISSFGVLSTAMSSADNLSTRIRAIDLVAEVATQYKGQNGQFEGKDAFRSLIPVLEKLSQENNPEIKSRAQTH